MSPPQLPQTDPVDGPTETEHDAEPLLALLDADYTQTILRETRTDPRPARALADTCDASRTTIYRRLNRLEDAGLVTSHIAHDPDGHHRTVYEATLESVTLDVTDDGYAVTVQTTSHRPAARPAPPQSSD